MGQVRVERPIVKICYLAVSQLWLCSTVRRITIATQGVQGDGIIVSSGKASVNRLALLAHNSLTRREVRIHRGTDSPPKYVFLLN